MAQAVEHLLCKHEALNSKPSPIKKKKKTEKEILQVSYLWFEYLA
jgi:hypothetical protein